MSNLSEKHTLIFLERGSPDKTKMAWVKNISIFNAGKHKIQAFKIQKCSMYQDLTHMYIYMF